jgi:hypothetical protein
MTHAVGGVPSFTVYWPSLMKEAIPMPYEDIPSLKRQFKELQDKRPSAYFIVTLGLARGEFRKLRGEELIRCCSVHRCVSGFAVFKNTIVVICQRRDYDMEFLEHTLGHYIMKYHDADVVKKWYHPQNGGGK